MLAAAEVDALLRACSRRSTTGKRAAALVALGFSTGLRVSEALALVPGDVDHDRGLVQVRRGKGGAARTVAVDATALAYLDRWLDERRKLKVPARSVIFCTRTGEAMADAHVRRLMPRLAKRAKISKRVHYHALRHSMATETAATPGATLQDVQYQLGHSSLTSTQRYLSEVSPDRLRDVMAARIAHRTNGKTGKAATA